MTSQTDVNFYRREPGYTITSIPAPPALGIDLTALGLNSTSLAMTASFQDIINISGKGVIFLIGVDNVGSTETAQYEIVIDGVIVISASTLAGAASIIPIGAQHGTTPIGHTAREARFKTGFLVRAKRATLTDTARVVHDYIFTE